MEVFRISIIVEDAVDGNAKVRTRPMIVETVRLTMTVQEEYRIEDSYASNCRSLTEDMVGTF